MGPGCHGGEGRGAWRRAGAVPLACRPPCLAAPAPAHAMATPAWAERPAWAGRGQGPREAGEAGAEGLGGPHGFKQFQTVSNGFKPIESVKKRFKPKRYQTVSNGFNRFLTVKNGINCFKLFETNQSGACKFESFKSFKRYQTGSNSFKWFQTT